MYDYELYKILWGMFSHRRVQFDVLPLDGLDGLQIQMYPVCLIVNNQNSLEPGEHWLAIYIPWPGRHLEFYDSYGRGIASYPQNFANFARRNNLSIVENIVQVQNYNSEYCGHYCIYFLYKRLSRKTPMSIYAQFSSNYANNDRMIHNFVKSKCYLKGNVNLDGMSGLCCKSFSCE
jgi:hypothetical protein